MDRVSNNTSDLIYIFCVTYIIAHTSFSIKKKDKYIQTLRLGHIFFIKTVDHFKLPVSLFNVFISTPQLTH